MEIALAVLLFFGGFALGSATAEKNDGAELSSNDASQIQTTKDSVLATRGMRECLPSKPGRYRDLTQPYSDQRDSAAPKGDTCEGMNRSDNLSGFPPSMEVSSTDE